MNIVEWIESHGELFIELSERVWEFAELGFTETRSSGLLISALEKAGFAVERGIAEIPTAFEAS